MSILRPIRKDIQALRAIAVLMVVVFHLWPNRLTGGFAGVDVFFVISGFLISGSLFEEIENRQTIGLVKFWARRIRRLLPAALFVIALTTLAAATFVPAFTRQGFFPEAIASTFYFENWQLAASSTDYFAGASSPFQHFWSLAVEEQFYLFWPIILSVLAIVFARRSKAAVKVALFALSGASFIYSLYLSHTAPSLAYFNTFGRVWEFGLGAIISLVGQRFRFSTSARSVLSLLGFGAILVSALGLNPKVEFPGWAALFPALGAAAVILAGLQGLPAWLDRSYGFRPIAFTGEISYSLYLWHWPLIILLPWATGYQPRAYELIAIFAVSYLVAFLSKRFIEDRFRTAPALIGRRPRFTFVLAAASSALILAISGLGSIVTAAEVSVGSGKTPTLDRAKNDSADPGHKCMTDPDSTTVKICKYGRIGADYRVLLVGDSHAAMHLGAWQQLANDGQFELDLAYKASCSFNLEKRNESSRGASCQAWNENLQSELAKETKYDLVLTSYFTTVKATEIESYSHDRLAVEGFKAAWEKLQARGSIIVAVRDGVNMDASMRHCWETAVYDASKCSMAENAAFVTDLAQKAASSPPAALTLDFTDIYCQQGRCPAKINGVYVYRDSSHISLAFSQAMARDWYHRLTQLGVKMPAIAEYN